MPPNSPTTLSDSDVQKILATFKEVESGGDYTKPSKTSTASGAYQFINDTWRRFTNKFNVGTEYKRAAEAPPEIQDAVAEQAVRDIFKQVKGDVSKIPLVWYTGNPQGRMTEEALRINRGLTPDKYQQKWLSIFNKQATPKPVGPVTVPAAAPAQTPSAETLPVTLQTPEVIAAPKTVPKETPTTAPGTKPTSNIQLVGMDLLPASYKTALAMNYLADTDPENEVMTKAMELMEASGLTGDGGGAAGGKILQQYAQNIGQVNPFQFVLQQGQAPTRPVVPRMPEGYAVGGPVGEESSTAAVEVDGYKNGGEVYTDPMGNVVGSVEGAVPKEDWSQRVQDIGKEVLRSTQYYPYDLVGAPVDIVNLGLKGIDYVAGTKLGQEKPVGGSEWLIEKSRQAGMAQEPTGSGVETATRFGMGFMNPAAPVRATAQGIKALAPVGKALELPGFAQTAPVGAINLGKPKPGINYDVLRPTENSPFIGELERIVADLPGPVKLSEFERYLAKNARNYENARFADLADQVSLEKGSMDVKMTPQEILDRLQSTSPQRYKTDIIEPGTKSLYQRQDNPFPEKPVGTINLELKVPRELQDIQSKLDTLNTTIGEVSSFRILGTYDIGPNAIKKSVDDVRYALDQFSDTNPELVKKGQDRLDDAQSVLLNFSKLYKSRDEVVYPMISNRVKEWDSNPETIPAELRDKRGRLDYDKAIPKVMDQALKDFREAYSNIVVSSGGAETGADFGSAYHKLKDFVDKAKNKPYYEIASGPELNDVRGIAQESSIDFIQQLARVRRESLNRLVNVRDELNEANKLDIYEGGHPSITKNNPISFSRFVDFDKDQALQSGIELKEPDRGAMLVLELQSDRAKAAKRGMAEEAFPGMAQLPQVTQQLMIKNAIYGAAKRDKGLLLFPGTDSAQAQLYEKIGPNLKQAVKDLGPGLKVEQFEFANEAGNIAKRWGVYIDKDAAQRILKQGIRFAKGGMVDKPLYDRAA